MKVSIDEFKIKEVFKEEIEQLIKPSIRKAQKKEENSKLKYKEKNCNMRIGSSGVKHELLCKKICVESPKLLHHSRYEIEGEI